MPLCSISSCLNSTSDTHDRRPNGEPYRMCASCREKWRVKAVQRKGGVKRPRVKRERVGVWSWAPEEARNIGEMDEDEEVNGDDNVADADGEPDWESQGEDESEDGEQDGADADDVSESELELSLGSGSGGSSTLVNTSAPTRNRQDSRVIDVDSTNDESDNDNDDIAALRVRKTASTCIHYNSAKLTFNRAKINPGIHHSHSRNDMVCCTGSSMPCGR
ncbi:hypothetical protein BJ138DRAFT_1155048 [Hygrophoropsis aurantiaca]|uniref:Uncharacterized protein n=1 Tax=Hygrophoropsis aurantiaca TaxID=72124 RepID=A0ACB8A7Q8_9AGAM|nr:hypothetical protein BJ138DRAFT_1155048 [Hygrophoropsis aurantiaca]